MKKKLKFLRRRAREVKLGLCRRVFSSRVGKKISWVKNSLDAYSSS
jgi:hypothetical protein